MTKILAMKWRRLGDTILWTAALEALRQFYPSAQLDLALPRPFDPLFTDDGRFARRWVWDRNSSAWNFARQLRRERYDLILSFHASGTSAWVTWLARPKMKLLHHHSRAPRRFFSDRIIPHLGIPMAATERDLNVVRALGWNGPSPAPRLFVSGPEREKAKALLKDLSPPLVLMNAGASRPAKRWSLERYAQLARLLSPQASVGVIVDPAEDPFARDLYLRDQLARHARFFQTSDLRALAALLAEAQIFVGVDSGVKHLAAAVGTPTLTLFGPESLGEWHCYASDRHRALQEKVLCRFNDADDPRFAWCGVEVCPFASHACLNLITPEEVADAVRRMTSGQTLR